VTKDDVWLDRALGRIRAVMLGLAVGGTAAAFFLGGWRSGLGFLAGALASLANFRWLHQLTASLGGTAPPRKRLLAFLGLRYLLLVLCGYVIVKFFGFSLTAALLGLFVAIAAVIFEVFYELLYARD
jgi:hypothetical protein